MSPEAMAWWSQINRELDWADAAWAERNSGKGRVCSRRAAGMALKAWLADRPRAGWGQNFMHHLRALADDAEFEMAVRECAARLAARKRPEAGYIVAIQDFRTPMDDAREIVAWCAARLEA